MVGVLIIYIFMLYGKSSVPFKKLSAECTSKEEVSRNES